MKKLLLFLTLIATFSCASAMKRKKKKFPITEFDLTKIIPEFYHDEYTFNFAWNSADPKFIVFSSCYPNNSTNYTHLHVLDLQKKERISSNNPCILISPQTCLHFNGMIQYNRSIWKFNPSEEKLVLRGNLSCKVIPQENTITHPRNNVTATLSWKKKSKNIQIFLEIQNKNLRKKNTLKLRFNQAAPPPLIKWNPFGNSIGLLYNNRFFIITI